MHNTTLYNVTNTAKITGVHPQTLRHYEKIGLLVPKRTLGGVRRYSEYDISKLKLIRTLANDGVNLEGIKIIITQQEEINILRRQLEASRDDSVFTYGENGITVGQFSKMSLRGKIRAFRKMNKAVANQARRIITHHKPLEIEQ